MPGLVRKLLIFAAVDGLILQPAPPRNHPPATQQAIKIDYKGNVGPLLKDRREEDTAPVSLEAHGIVGNYTPLKDLNLLLIELAMEEYKLIVVCRSPNGCHLRLPHIDIWTRTSGADIRQANLQDY